MPDNARYLRNVTSSHMGIHKTAEDVIYYRLYSTNVAVFYPPTPDGVSKIEMNYFNSQLTHIFMFQQGLNYYYQTTTDDREVKVPYVESWDRELKKDIPSATLYFDANNKLIVERSSHKDIYTYKSSADDKQKRKDFKKKLDVLMTLAMFRLSEYRANAHLKEELGQPFGLAWRNKPIEIDEFERVVKEVGVYETDNPHYINAFLDLGQSVFNILASRRAYDSNLFYSWGRKPEELADMERKKKEIINEVDAEDFKKSLTNRLLDLAEIKTGSVKTPWGQFPDTLPRKSFS